MAALSSLSPPFTNVPSSRSVRDGSVPALPRARHSNELNLAERRRRSSSSAARSGGRPALERRAKRRPDRVDFPLAVRTPGAKMAAMSTRLQKITPFLWYTKEAEDAARFYASVFPDSRVDRVVAMPTDSPSGPAGSVKVVDFTLFGQRFTAMSAGPHEPFTQAISFVVNCETQDEIDRYWNALLDGGKAEACGWLRDRFGVSWQITPTVLVHMMSSADPARGKRAADAMMKMVKLDIAALKAAFDGK
jgi:predicted 3-demethylubiquinone-9 3-methyltransferase (glyoxalase superfamily)